MKKVEWCSFNQLNLKMVCPLSAKLENGVEGISLSLLNLKMGSELAFLLNLKMMTGLALVC